MKNSHVSNFDLPDDTEVFVHRIGNEPRNRKRGTAGTDGEQHASGQDRASAGVGAQHGAGGVAGRGSAVARARSAGLGGGRGRAEDPLAAGRVPSDAGDGDRRADRVAAVVVGVAGQGVRTTPVVRTCGSG